jgi:hypothetical protein
LEKLEKLVDDTKVGGFSCPALRARTAKLASKLVDYMAEEIECRLDRIYLEELHESSTRSSGDGGVQEEISLKEELDSLYSEIRVLSEMAVRQEFEAPIMKAVADHEAHLHAESCSRMNYVSERIHARVSRC